MNKYVVIGNPVEHSRSPQIHVMFASQAGIKISYRTLLAPHGAFEQTVRSFIEEGGAGANVTVPFKLDAFQMADVKTDRAAHAGAANTLIFSGNKIRADNTDGIGLVRDITQNLNEDLRGKRVLMLGAGGAARGVLLPLVQECPTEIVVLNRTEDKAHMLIDLIAAEAKVFGIETRSGSLTDSVRDFDVVINASSTSLEDAEIPLSVSAIRRGGLAYDMMYGKTESTFFKWAREAGASRKSDGLGMLVEQAAESFFLWQGIRPETSGVIRALRNV